MSFFLKILLFLIDVLLLNFSIFTTFYFFDDLLWISDKSGFIYLIIYSNLTWLFLILVSTPYSLNKGWTVSKVLKNQLSFLFIHLIVIASLVIFFNRNYHIYQMAFIYLLFAPLFFGYRILIFFLRKLLSKNVLYTNYLLIGRNSLSFEVRKFYLINHELGYRFKGYVDFEQGAIPFDKIQDMASLNEVQEIFCCAPSVKEGEINQLINFGLNSLIKVKMIIQPEIELGRPIQLEKFDKHPGIDIAIINLDDPMNRFLKRGFDILFSSVCIIVIFPWLFPIVALLIKISSRGPIFFVQQRNGAGNVPFGCFKFRTMKINSEIGAMHATKHDPRITGIGSFLRKTSIDELPQFINVFIGNMSLIGPRPQAIKFNENYAEMLKNSPSKMNIISRHYVKPGITGLAQCMGYRGDVSTLADIEGRVNIDRYYIENWTFWLDIKIVFMTVVSLIRGSDKAF